MKKIRFSVTTTDRKIIDAFNRAFMTEETEDGGPGSGNWGHKGRPGKRGGSGQGGGKKYRSQKEDGTYERKALEDPHEMAGKYTNGKRTAFQGGHGPKFMPQGSGKVDPLTNPAKAKAEDVRRVMDEKDKKVDDLLKKSMDVSKRQSDRSMDEARLRSMYWKVSRFNQDQMAEFQKKADQLPDIKRRTAEIDAETDRIMDLKPGDDGYEDVAQLLADLEKQSDSLYKQQLEAENANDLVKMRRDYDKAMKDVDKKHPPMDELKAATQKAAEAYKQAVDDRDEYAKKVKDHPEYLDKIYKSDIRKRLEKNGVESRPPVKYNKSMTGDEIVNRLAGGDRTRGSCASLALAYAACRGGYDVLDFRDGESRQAFSSDFRGALTIEGADTKIESGHGENVCAKNLLKGMEAGKEFILSAGRHAAVVRKLDDGRIQYLELQSATRSGWHDFDKKLDYTLSERFKCSRTMTYYGAELTSVDSIKNNPELLKLVSYINTAEDAQRKGKNGTIK